MGKKDKETEISRTELSAQINAELEKAIDDLTLFDDDLMSKVFDGNIEAAELLLKIVLERDDIKVKRERDRWSLKAHILVAETSDLILLQLMRMAFSLMLRFRGIPKAHI